MKMKKKQYSLVGLFIVTLLFNIAFIFNVNVFADTLSTNYQPVIDNVNKTADSVELQWHVSDDDYYYFNIYRATSKDGDYQLLSQSYFLIILIIISVPACIIFIKSRQYISMKMMICKQARQFS